MRTVDLMTGTVTHLVRAHSETGLRRRWVDRTKGEWGKWDDSSRLSSGGPFITLGAPWQFGATDGLGVVPDELSLIKSCHTSGASGRSWAVSGLRRPMGDRTARIRTIEWCKAYQEGIQGMAFDKEMDYAKPERVCPNAAVPHSTGVNFRKVLERI